MKQHKKESPAERSLRALRRRLTVTFSVLTALVLTAALLATCVMTRREAISGTEKLFSAALAALTDKLRVNDTISDAWLAEQEMRTDSVIAIEDNGTPLHFTGAFKTETTRESLVTLSKQAASAAGLNFSIPPTLETTVHFSVTDTVGDNYVGAAVYLPREPRTLQGKLHTPYVGIVMLQSRSAVQARLSYINVQFVALWLAGCILLCGISAVLCRVAVNPTRFALRRQTEFVAAASHELRGPLAVIRANLEAVQNPKTPPQQAQAFLGAALTETQHMTLLTDDLLLLAAGDAGAMTLYREALSPDTLCVELYEQYSALCAAQGRVLTVRLPDGPVRPLHADRQRLHQLLGILLQNAFSHTPAHTPLEVTLAQSTAAGKLPARTRLCVIDHGPGIPDGQKHRVFERFYRADESRTGKSHCGLGLSVARQIAAAHGYQLTLQDTSGGGCTFSVLIIDS